MLLYDKQQEVVRSKARFKVIRAGRRSGKSTVSIEMMLFTAISKKNRNVFYISPNQKQSRSIIWESLKARLAGIGDLNESRLEVTLPTVDKGTSRIFIAGFESKENFRGLRADLIIFDEVDTMQDFFIGWQEIFRPALIDTAGSATFIGTPKKENPNLRRLEKLKDNDKDWASFHFTSLDNPYLPEEEKIKAKAELDHDTYRQEILAEYLENAGSLFRYSSLVDVFTNTVTKTGKKYLLVDIADDGSDKTIFSFWEDLEEYKREEYARLNTEQIIEKIREYAQQDRIPYSHIAVDAIGVGAGAASSSFLDGIIGFKGSYSAIKTDDNIVRVPSVGYLSSSTILTSDYKNLRSQCIFTLADLVNNHKIASRVSGIMKEKVIEELFTYQDVSTGDGKRMATQTEDIKAILGRSPDHASSWIMRMYFVVRAKVDTEDTAQRAIAVEKQRVMFDRSFRNASVDSTE